MTYETKQSALNSLFCDAHVGRIISVGIIGVNAGKARWFICFLYNL